MQVLFHAAPKLENNLADFVSVLQFIDIISSFTDQSRKNSIMISNLDIYDLRCKGNSN